MPQTASVSPISVSSQSAAPAALNALFGAPGPDLDIVARAAGLQSLIRSRAKASEDQRRVTEDVVEAIHGQRPFHIAVPSRLGGLGGNFRTSSSCLWTQRGIASQGAD